MSALASRAWMRRSAFPRAGTDVTVGDGLIAAVVIAAWLGLGAALFTGVMAPPGPFALPAAALASIPIGALGWMLLARDGTPAAVRMTAGATGTLAAAAVTAVAASRQPLLALGVPAVAVTAVALSRYPTVGFLVAFAVSGTYGSLIAFWTFPTASLTHLVLAGLWAAAVWTYLVGGRQAAVWLWPGAIAVGIYLAVTAVSIVLAENRYVAFESFLESGWYMLAFLLVAYAGWSARTHMRMARAVVLVAFAVGGYATLRWIIGPAGPEEALADNTIYNFVGGELRTVGSFPSGQELGGWTAVAIPFCVALGLGASGRWRVVALTAAVLCMIGLVASEHRTSLAAVVVGVAIVVGLYQAARAVPGIGLGRTSLAVLAAAAVAIGVFALTGGSSDPEDHGYSALVNPTSDDPSVAQRLEKWEQAFEDLEGNPLGYGVGSASFIARRENRFRLNIGANDVDNGYLKLALEQGLAMMTFYIVALLLVLAGLVRRTLVTSHHVRATIAAGAVGALVAFLVLMGSATYADGPRALAVWLIVGLGAAQFTTSGRQRGVPSLTPTHRRGVERAPPPDALRVLFVCQNDFGAPSEKQALGFAQGLAERGHEVAIMLGGDIASADTEGAVDLPRITVAAYRLAGRSPRHADVQWARQQRPDLIHAFNSRTPTIAAARAFALATGAPVFVHFEDDEWRPHPSAPGDSLYRRFGRHARRMVSPVRPGSYTHSTGRSLEWVGRYAVALDALTPALAEEVRSRLGRECRVIRPTMPSVGGESDAGNQTDAARQLEQRGEGEPTALFTGTVWPVYLPDVLLGMRAVAEVRRRGRRLRLVHVGRIHPRLDFRELARQAGLEENACESLGYLPFTAMDGLLQAATMLLQPGPPSEFNRLRLPAKMQAYLRSGTATVTFAVGFAEVLEDRREVLKTYTGAVIELADRITELLDDPDLRERIGAGGATAARRLFDRRRNSQVLIEHYEAALGDRRASSASTASISST